MTLQGRKIATAMVALSAFVPNLCTIPQKADAQATAGDTMNVSAKIMNPLAISPSVNFKLNFKSFAIQGSGSFNVTPGGGHSISQGVTMGTANAGTAVLKVPQSVAFTLSIPTFKASSIIMKNGAGGAPSLEMTLKSLRFANVSNLSNISATLRNGTPAITKIKVTNAGGLGKMAVGAKIFFGPNQAVGTYVGTFVVRITL